MPNIASSRWADLQSNSHLPEVQATIRREISRRTIRVTLAPGGCIRIIPTCVARPVEGPEPCAADVPKLEEHHRRAPVLRIQRIAR
jgi:hypothetical protein